jgi:hypothetical protein
MSTHDLKPGDRVQVTARNRMHGYLPGDKGTIRSWRTVIGTTVYYTVDMDGPQPENVAIFTEEEIEPEPDTSAAP